MSVKVACTAKADGNSSGRVLPVIFCIHMPITGILAVG